MSVLGRLEKVDLRDIWKTEAQDFTPWLAGEDNLALLSDTLGIDLELEAVEQNVGPFRADILCKDTLSDRWVLVENQLERTDHTHLGQLMTYAAGLDAVTIVWIASRIADEHRAAMDWLNEITDTEVRFFALEVELWRIGESSAAPKFNVVSKPDDWSQTTERAARAHADGALTPLKQQYLAYWSRFLEKVAESEPKLRFSRPSATQYVTLGMGAGIQIYCAIRASDRSIRVGASIQGKNPDAKFQLFEARKQEIESALGFSLDWLEKSGRQRFGVEIVKHDADPTIESDWGWQHEWLLYHSKRLRETLLRYVEMLRNAAQDGFDMT